MQILRPGSNVRFRAYSDVRGSSYHAVRIRHLCWLMVSLVVVNTMPMLYILLSDPNKWLVQRSKDSRQVLSNRPKAATSKETPSVPPKPSSEKLILFVDFPEYYELAGITGPSGLAHCNNNSPFDTPIKCEAAVDWKRLNQSDAVIFYSHGKSQLKDFNFLPVKLKGQTWTFFAVESPLNSNNAAFGDAVFYRRFNSTMTYRIDSEFWHGYIRTQRRKVPWSEEIKKKQEMTLRQIFRNKTRMAAIFISNCKSRSGRDRYIRQLKRLMDVDVFGRCGSLKCEDRDKCDQMLARDYKFYLAFENSFCTDYVTEKLLRVMKSMRVVPVVRGGADYGKLFPRNSLIDTGSFFSAYELAHHLNALAQDEDEWVRMFRWNWDWEVAAPMMPICQYCYHLFKHHRSYYLYGNVSQWWNKGACFSPTDL